MLFLRTKKEVDAGTFTLSTEPSDSSTLSLNISNSPTISLSSTPKHKATRSSRGSIFQSLFNRTPSKPSPTTGQSSTSDSSSSSSSSSSSVSTST